MTSLTLFKSIFDNKTVQRLEFNDFDAFATALYKLSERPLGGKKDAPLMSPATFKPNTTRSNANVMQWAGWCALDVDDHEFEGNLENELHSLYGDWHYVCYSTASSTIDHPKFRLVFPLKTSVGSSDIKSFWHALNESFGRIGDGQTKDLSRMYYVPATYADANNFIFTNIGQYIDPYALMSKYPLPQKQGSTFMERLPDEMQRMIIQHRVDQLENKNYTWNSYRDCPFVSKRMLAEYSAITGTGWYAKMYAFMVSVAGNAIRRQYPITPSEISMICKELDNDNGKWYEKRPIDKEAERAIEYIYKNL